MSMAFVSTVALSVRLGGVSRVHRHVARTYCCAARSVKSAAQPAHLYLVSTPIGNVGDITVRALNVLSTVDVILAEDTRRTRLLLSLVLPDPSTRQAQILSCHEHNARDRAPAVISALEAQRSVALVSDAGTPCLSDPGLPVVRAATDAGFRVVPVPGASALLAAAVVAGAPLDAFSFFGFLPRAGSARTSALQNVAETSHAVALYEAPHRLVATLGDLAAAFDDDNTRSICVCRELTKKYETVRNFDDIAAAHAHFAEDEQPRGEFVLIIGPKPVVKKMDIDDIASSTVSMGAVAEGLLAEGVSVKTISKVLSSCTSLSKKPLYNYLLGLKEKESVGASPGE